MRIQNGLRTMQHFRRPGQISRNQRDLGLRDNASGLGQRVPRTEEAYGLAQQLACEGKIAKLGDGDASQRKRWRIVAQGNQVQRAKRITRRQRARCLRDQR